MRRTSTARVIEARDRTGQPRGPTLRLLPSASLRPREPGVIPHPEEYMNANKKVLSDMLAIFEAHQIRYALVGGLVAGLYGKARTTEDVDLLIPKSAMKILPAEIAARGYTLKSSEDMLRACKRGVAVADLVVREANPVLRAAS